ncbi:MAG: hypothetical protein ABIS50_26475 [Luteolibacter sp.]|uniref:hypothetical protein n=1 Tax=Luteolibacter sp. TaxID=1962973 RepID=UPI003267CF46
MNFFTIPAIALILPATASTLEWTAVREPGVGGAVTAIVVNPANPSQIIASGDMLGPSVSNDGGESWLDTFGLKNWECAEAIWKPGSKTEVWLGTMGGIYKSTDGGKNWTEKRNGLPAPESYWGYNVPIQKILFDPNQPSRMLAFGGSRRKWVNMKYADARYGAVWESTDSGETWKLKSVIHSNNKGVGGDVQSATFAAGSNQIIFVSVRDQGIFRSDDSGATWILKNQGIANGLVDTVATHPADPKILWCSMAAGRCGVFKSTDGGETWTASGDGLSADPANDHFCSKISVSRSNPDVLYVADSNWQQLFRSGDAGVHWSNITDKRMPAVPTGLGFQGNWIEIDPLDANTVYTCNSVHIFKTTNGGETWMETTSKPGKTPDTWQGRGFSGYVPMKAKWNPYQPSQLVLMAMDDGKFMTSTDMTDWHMHGPTLSGWGGGIDVTFAADGKTLYAAFGQDGWEQQIAGSKDGGLHWTILSCPGKGMSSSLCTLPQDSSKLWFVRGGKLHYSADAGDSWKKIDVGDGDLMEIEASSGSAPVLYITARTGIYRGSPANDFKKLVNIESAESNHIAIDPSDPERFWVASWKYNQYHSGIWRYNHGDWKRVRQDEYAYDVAVDPADSNRVIYVTNHNPGVEHSQATGVWMTESALAENPEWIQQNSGLPMLRGTCITFNPNKSGEIIVGLNGRGFYKSSVIESP